MIILNGKYNFAKVTPPKNGTASTNKGNNSGTTKPPKGNQNPNIKVR